MKKISANLIAERSIYSAGVANDTKSLYYTRKSSVFLDLPQNQLYIYGSVLSHNTIGGGTRDGSAICPYTQTDIYGGCTYDTAIPYDWNYFRAYRNPGSTTRAYTKTPLLDAYSVVIEYDSRVLSDPPP